MRNERTYWHNDLCSDGNWSSFGRWKGVLPYLREALSSLNDDEKAKESGFEE